MHTAISQLHGQPIERHSKTSLVILSSQLSPSSPRPRKALVCFPTVCIRFIFSHIIPSRLTLMCLYVVFSICLAINILLGIDYASGICKSMLIIKSRKIWTITFTKCFYVSSLLSFFPWHFNYTYVKVFYNILHIPETQFFFTIFT